MCGVMRISGVDAAVSVSVTGSWKSHCSGGAAVQAVDPILEVLNMAPELAEMDAVATA